MNNSLMDAEKMKYVAGRLPVAHWLKLYPVRNVERRIRNFGISLRVAKIAISEAKNETN